MAESSCSVVSNNQNNQKQKNSVDQSAESADKIKTEKVMEPILLEDHKYFEVPKTLRNLFEYFDQERIVPTRMDILVGLVYILMAESGFVPKDFQECEYHLFNYNRLLKLTQNFSLIRYNKKDKCYSFTLIIPPFPLYECKIACVPISDDLLVNCVVKEIENCRFNIVLDPLTYFTSSTTNVGEYKVQSLKHLSRLVKNEISFPCKSSILKMNNQVFPCFECMPPEIVFLITKKLSLADRNNLGATCAYFSGLVGDHKFRALSKLASLNNNFSF